MTQTVWTTPPQLAAGYTVQGSDWNNSVYANTLYLYDPPMAKYHATADLGIPNAAWTTMIYQTADWDTDGIGPAPNSGLFTIQTAGIYLWIGTWRFAPAGGGIQRDGRLNVNSGTLIGGSSGSPISTTIPAYGVVTARQFMNVGDTCKVELYQDNTNPGGSLNNNGSVQPLGASLSCKWEGPGS